MKKYLFISFLSLYLTTIVAQNGKYIPFPSNMIVYAFENKWTSDRGWYSSSRFEIEGDTIINGLKYSKYFLALANKFGATDFPTTDLKELNKLIGGIRNDIPAKKVYLYSFGTKTEELLYDFDLHVGDTLFKNSGYKFYHSLMEDEYYPKIDTVWVSRIDSVLMSHDNLYHKRFNFKTKFRRYTHTYATITSDSVFSGTSWGFSLKIDPLIEGVGPDFNPVSHYGHFEYGYSYTLFCRSIDKKIVYSDVGTPPPPFMWKANCNSILTGVDEKEENTSILLYPNPSNGKFNLGTTESELKFFEISNLIGVKMLSSKLENDKTEIDLSLHPPGIYFIRLFYKNGTSVTRKILIE